MDGLLAVGSGFLLEIDAELRLLARELIVASDGDFDEMVLVCLSALPGPFPTNFGAIV